MVKIQITTSEAAAGQSLPQPGDLAQRLDQLLARFTGNRDELISILQRVQEEFGYLQEEAMRAIADFAGVPESRVYAVATFYAQFRFTPIGRHHVMVCRGTSCHVRGAPRVLQEIEKQLGIKEGQVTPDREYSLETVACIGACGVSPCLTINKKVEAKVSPKMVSSLLRAITLAGGSSTPPAAPPAAE